MDEMQSAKSARKIEEQYLAQIAEKDKQLGILQVRALANAQLKILDNGDCRTTHCIASGLTSSARAGYVVIPTPCLLPDCTRSNERTTQGMLEDLQSENNKPDAFSGSERTFSDDMLLSILQEKDKMADELHTLNNAYAEIKVGHA